MKRKQTLLLAVFFLSSACVSTSKYKLQESKANQLTTDKASLEQQLAEAQHQVNVLTQEKAALEQNLKAAQAEKADLAADLQARKDDLSKRLSEATKSRDELARQLRETEQAKEAEIAKLKGTYDQLVNNLKGEIANGEIQVTQLKGKLTVNLVEKILFDSGKAEIKLSGQQVLARIGEILKKVQDKDIRIEGHTDNVPIGGALKERYPTNWELSTARATTVVRFLQEKAQISPQKLIAAGYGEYRPVTPNETDAGRAQNRRIEIVLVASDQPAPPTEAAPTNANSTTSSKP